MMSHDALSVKLLLSGYNRQYDYHSQDENLKGKRNYETRWRDEEVDQASLFSSCWACPFSLRALPEQVVRWYDRVGGWEGEKGGQFLDGIDGGRQTTNLKPAAACPP